MRKCGTCFACCVWPAIKELDKPARVPCKHLDKQDHGCCTIWSDRPKTCSDYNCAWLRGMGADEDKPNNTNVMIDRRSTQFGVVLVAHQLKSGAAMTPEGQSAIERTTRDEGLPCLIADYEDVERVIGVAGPEDFRKEVESKSVDGVIRLGGRKQWINNIVSAAMQGRIMPGLTDGR